MFVGVFCVRLGWEFVCGGWLVFNWNRFCFHEEKYCFLVFFCYFNLNLIFKVCGVCVCICVSISDSLCVNVFFFLVLLPLLFDISYCVTITRLVIT